MADIIQIKAPVPEGWRLNILYKNIRHIYFRADHHEKVFNISAPKRIGRPELEGLIRAKAKWMEDQAGRMVCSPLIPKSLTDGDAIFFKGVSQKISIQPCLLNRKPKVCLEPGTGLQIRVRAGSSPGTGTKMLVNWYRENLAREIEVLGAKWQAVMNVRADEFRIKRMKTRWGSCNPRAKRVWINLALICLSPDLLEYVMVHELAHLIEPGHNQRFYRVMDQFLPQWPELKNRLSGFGPGLG